MLKTFASNKVSEAGINKFRGRKSSNKKVLLNGACRKLTV